MPSPWSKKCYKIIQKCGYALQSCFLKAVELHQWIRSEDESDENSNSIVFFCCSPVRGVVVSKCVTTQYNCCEFSARNLGHYWGAFWTTAAFLMQKFGLHHLLDIHNSVCCKWWDRPRYACINYCRSPDVSINSSNDWSEGHCASGPSSLGISRAGRWKFWEASNWTEETIVLGKCFRCCF